MVTKKQQIAKQIKNTKVHPHYDLTLDSIVAIVEMNKDPFAVLRNSFLYGYSQRKIEIERR